MDAEINFKEKYWSQGVEGFLTPSTYTGREYIALGKLLIKLKEWQERQLIPDNIYIKPAGIGTLTTSLVPQHYHDLLDKYDFILFVSAGGHYYPLIFLDVTGSSWSREESERRYGEEVWAILSTKVEVAQRHSVMGRVFFLFYNDAENKMKVISALRVLNLEKKGLIRKDSYEQGAKSFYYLIPPRYWKNITELRMAIRGYYQLFLAGKR